MKDSPLAAEAMGVSIRRTRTYVLLIAAAVGGAAGACYYMVTLQVSPTAGFSMNWMAIILFAVILGGIGTLEGPIVGVAVYFLLRETMGKYRLALFHHPRPAGDRRHTVRSGRRLGAPEIGDRDRPPAHSPEDVGGGAGYLTPAPPILVTAMMAAKETRLASEHRVL
jgi:Branched-chain amino acid transport system / permease component